MLASNEYRMNKKPEMINSTDCWCSLDRMAGIVRDIKSWTTDGLVETVDRAKVYMKAMPT